MLTKPGTRSARLRKRSSLSASARSARRRSVMSSTATVTCGAPFMTIGSAPTRSHAIGRLAFLDDLERELHAAQRDVPVERRLHGVPQRAERAVGRGAATVLGLRVIDAAQHVAALHLAVGPVVQQALRVAAGQTQRRAVHAHHVRVLVAHEHRHGRRLEDRREVGALGLQRLLRTLALGDVGTKGERADVLPVGPQIGH